MSEFSKNYEFDRFQRRIILASLELRLSVLLTAEKTSYTVEEIETTQSLIEQIKEK